MRTYDIDCKCQIVLYGFNNYTQKQISEIKEQGYFCGGIIDRRAQEIKMYQDIPVVSDIRELRQSKDACVFIMLQNALNHMEVAETLYRQGIKKILFVPMKCNAASQKIRIQLIEKYNMMQGCQYNLLRKIPYVQADFFEKNREKLLSQAVNAARSIGYDSAGTMEFLMDKQGNFYFMEMNTRIQVEHPVTEAITGVDLIKWQIKIASGQHLTLKQEDIQCHGHAMECRINAEDVAHDFAPSPGPVTFMHVPGGHGVRVDTAVYNGSIISPYYDSMIMKLIVSAGNRLECIKKMRASLEETIVSGVKTNIEFNYLTLYQKEFIEGSHDIGYAPILLKRLKENGQFI